MVTEDTKPQPVAAGAAPADAPLEAAPAAAPGSRTEAAPPGSRTEAPHPEGAPLASRGMLLAERYRLHEPIGHGGMSVVFRAYDQVLDRPVAVKMLARVDDERLRLRLRHEARACGRLNHPRIAQVFDYGETDGDAPAPYIVMELVTGEPLSRRLAGGAALRWQTATAIGAQIAQALSAAHACGLVHRDIKPDNVIITATGVKLVDFGICAAIGAPDADDEGQLLGTPSYVAPERIVDAPVGPATDMYSLGVLLYRMLTGALPWTVDTRTQLLEAHLFVDPAPLPPLDGLPAEVATLCAACLAKAPQLRPTSADAAALLHRASRREGWPGDAGSDHENCSVVVRDADTARLGARMLPPVRAHEPTAGDRRVRHRLFAVALAAVSATLLIAAWATTGRPAHVAAADPPQCSTALTVVSDSGSGFIARLTITNTSAVALHGWQLNFAFPGKQTIQADRVAGFQPTATSSGGVGYPVMMSQSGPNVVARTDPGQILEPGSTTVLPLRALYRGTNPLPTRFDLNGRVCDTKVAGATAAPTVTPTPPSTTATRPPTTAATRPPSTGKAHGNGKPSKGGGDGGGDGDGGGKGKDGGNGGGSGNGGSGPGSGDGS